MNIVVNGQPAEVAGPLTAAALLEQLHLRREGVAVEINRQVVPRPALATTEVREGDRIEVVTLVGGG